MKAVGIGVGIALAVVAAVVAGIAIEPAFGFLFALIVLVFTFVPLARSVWTASESTRLSMAYSREQDSRDRVRIQVLLVLLCGLCVLPQLVNAVTSTRRANTVAGAASYSTLATALSYGLVALVALFILIVLVRRRTGASFPLGAVLMALLPWVAVQASSIFTGSGQPVNSIVYPLVVLCFAGLAIRIENLSVLAYLGGALALLSIALGVVAPSIGLMTGVSGVQTQAEKAIIGSTLLAGVFGHSNTLGITIAMAFPALLLVRRKPHAVIAGGLMLFALAWSGSRTALLAVGFSILVVGISMLLKRLAAATWSVIALVGALSVIAILPLTNTDVAAFSYRGQIWQGSFEQFARTPVFGGGYGWYGYIAQYNNDLLDIAFHGHNLLVNTLATGGIALLLVLIVFMTALIRAAVRFVMRGQFFPLALLMVYFVLCTLEVVTRFRDVDAPFWVTLVPLAAIIIADAFVSAAPGPSPKAAEVLASRGSLARVGAR